MATTTAVTTTKQAPLATLQELLTKHKDQIAVALPKHMTPERMIRVALTAYSATPGLQKCTATSVAGAIVQASILGLEPNSVLGEAYLVPFNRKVKGAGGRDEWITECQLIPGYKGLIKLVRNTGELVMVNAQPVHEKDDFDFEDGLDPYLRHKRAPGPPSERGPITAYWAGAVLKSGARQFVVMTREEVEAHRDKYSKDWENAQKYKREDSSTWSKEFDAMALKTCIRKLCKFLPMSVEAATAVGLDERHEAGVPQQFHVDIPLALQPAPEEFDAEVVEEPTRKSEQQTLPV